MTNEPKTPAIAHLFDAIAPDYDRLNHVLSLDIDKTWRRRALRAIVDGPQPQRILDLACGTGDMSIAIAKQTTGETHIDGVDLSEGMLSVMKRKVEALELTDRIETHIGNAECLTFPDNTFDRVTIGFGIRNVAHREVALSEILRVLKPGGRLVILELSIPSCPVIQGLYKLYFLNLLPWIGGVITGHKAAYRYLPASVIAFPPKAAWMATMTQCGFHRVTHRAMSIGICRLYTGEKIEKNTGIVA